MKQIKATAPETKLYNTHKRFTFSCPLFIKKYAGSNIAREVILKPVARPRKTPATIGFLLISSHKETIIRLNAHI